MNFPSQMIPARLDQFGHETEAAVDEWAARRGAGLALSALAPLLRAHDVSAAMSFLVERGLADRSDHVRAEMLNAAMTIVELHGKVSYLGAKVPKVIWVNSQKCNCARLEELGKCALHHWE